MVALTIFGISLFSYSANAAIFFHSKLFFVDDTTRKDSSKLKFPFRDKKPYDYNFKKSRFDLKDPDVLKKNTEYDPESNSYIEREKLGKHDLNPPTSKSFSDYLRDLNKDEQQDYFRTKTSNSIKFIQTLIRY